MYIFLDVDGVLNTEADWARKLYSINDTCVSSFFKLYKNVEDPKIVLSSSWRNGIARDGKTSVRIDLLVNALKPLGIIKLDKTGISPNGMRNDEIDHYLKYHDKDGYIILDDDPNLFEKKVNTPHLYVTDAKTGLTDKDVTLIMKHIKMFNKIEE